MDNNIKITKYLNYTLINEFRNDEEEIIAGDYYADPKMFYDTSIKLRKYL